MAVPFPFALRTLLASKSRTQPASFAMAQPRRGFAYVQAVGTDTPVFWDVSFRFDQFDAIRFQLWFTNVTQRGLLEFTLPIQTEFGLIDHVCRFLPDGLGDCQQDGATWSYSAKIMARAQVIPQAYLDAAELIAGLPNWNAWMGPLDIGLSEFPS